MSAVLDGIKKILAKAFNQTSATEEYLVTGPASPRLEKTEPEFLLTDPTSTQLAQVKETLIGIAQTTDYTANDLKAQFRIIQDTPSFYRDHIVPTINETTSAMIDGPSKAICFHMLTTRAADRGSPLAKEAQAAFKAQLTQSKQKSYDSSQSTRDLSDFIKGLPAASEQIEKAASEVPIMLNTASRHHRLS